MFNPDFWEVCLDPGDLDKYANEAGLWFETSADGKERLRREEHSRQSMQPIMDIISQILTQKQLQALMLYYLHQKTQEEVAQLMGISRRVVSQHLFGICRDGKQVGGALKKIRKICRQRGIGGSADGTYGSPLHSPLSAHAYAARPASSPGFQDVDDVQVHPHLGKDVGLQARC